MFPLFNGDERRQRRINLGGASAVATHEEVMQQAKAVRNERLQQRRRHDAAVSLQTMWRGELAKRKVRAEMRRIFDDNPLGINAMRCLVLLGDDEVRLRAWSERVTSSGRSMVSCINVLVPTADHLIRPAASLGNVADSQRESWIVLLRQLAVQLLRSVSRHSDSQDAFFHLKVLNAFLGSVTTDTTLSQKIAIYLLQHDYYPFLKESIEKIPLEAKSTSSTLPLLVPLLTAPLSIFSDDPELYSVCFVQTAQYILTIPLLPNRLPLQLLSQFSARLPLHMFHLLLPASQRFTELPIQEKVHLLANLAMFTPPRYKTFATSLPINAYLKLLSLLLADLPASVFEAPLSPGLNTLQATWTHGDDSGDEETQSTVGPSSFVAPVHPETPIVNVDVKTRTRLRTLATSKHAGTLIAASNAHPSTRMSLYGFFMALYTAWPACRAEVLTSVLAGSGSGLVRELYRSYVRSAPLGKDDDPHTLAKPEHSEAWLPLLLLTDLYTQALLTMGDDEFFASRSTATTTTSAVHRNPLTVDEVVSFSRQLMNIAFTLYWNESKFSKENVPGSPASWEGIRDKTTKLLQAIHARDSRRPFTPPGHWLFSAQLDMGSFIEAAIFDEQSLPSDNTALLPPGRGGRMLSKRLALLSPRLGVLNNIPFAIPFETRVQIFRQFIVNDMIASTGSADRFSRAHASRTSVTVRRGSVAADGFDKLGGANLKGLIEIKFIDQFGNEEAGIDGGGVFKEFFTSLCKEVFDTDRGLWLATKQNELYPNPISYAKEPHSLDWYHFIGRILGKALYEGILVDVAFAGFFLTKWLDKQSYLDDLASLDPELYNGLLFLKNFDGNPEDLSLTFAVVEDDLGEAKTIDLVPNGSNIPVTRENRLRYIYLVCHYRLTRQIRPQSGAFFDGLSEMIDPKWIRMFNQQELQILIGGINAPIDLDDLRRNTSYGGLFSDEDETINMFWRVVNTFDHEQRRALLRFVSSCSRPPLLGFKELQPHFCIRDSGVDQSRLPSASTCVNLLKLPKYTNERVLRGKLLQAITSNAGFDLS
ncbi:hypothetical protein M0805_005152 [Coniferiporia weirii]|nr:hypothetical protein M0805_005152 [Coniferiporia weirii]